MFSDRYSLSHILYLGYCYLRTKFLSRSFRIIRFPIDLRGFKFMKIGSGFTTGRGCRLEVELTYEPDRQHARLLIGSHVQLNDYVHITAANQVTIEDHVLIASKVYISDCSHGSYGRGGIHDDPDTIPATRKLYHEPVHIKENVWIGESVSILPGVTIGKGSIIGANSVVNRDIPDFCIAAGVPARVIKTFDPASKTWISIKRESSE